jgi:hypothetical protein
VGEEEVNEGEVRVMQPGIKDHRSQIDLLGLVRNLESRPVYCASRTLVNICYGNARDLMIIFAIKINL